MSKMKELSTAPRKVNNVIMFAMVSTLAKINYHNDRLPPKDFKAAKFYLENELKYDFYEVTYTDHELEVIYKSEYNDNHI